MDCRSDEYGWLGSVIRGQLDHPDGAALHSLANVPNLDELREVVLQTLD
jgi:hypothetical protein